MDKPFIDYTSRDRFPVLITLVYDNKEFEVVERDADELIKLLVELWTIKKAAEAREGH